MKKMILLILIALIGISISIGAEPVVIVNQGLGAEAIDSDTVQKIYLGKKSQWNNGDKIVMAALTEGSVHDSFLEKYVKKNAKQFDSFWKKMFFTGSGVPPKAFSTESEVVEFVSTTKGAIGYIDSATASSNVTVLNLN